ncbi:hypothetical protein Hanom_Chr09g00870531 [Helianthus anomalus]
MNTPMKIVGKHGHDNWTKTGLFNCSRVFFGGDVSEKDGKLSTLRLCPSNPHFNLLL